MNFWQEMKNKGEPIICLAPMADVTDSVFRHIVAKYSKEVSRGTLDTYVTYTEFVSADGLCLAPEKGRKRLLKDLEYSEIERPIVAQFFTSNPDHMHKAAKLATELGFNGVDINMGCPDKSIEKQGAGSALIKNPSLARQLIRAAKLGIKKASKKGQTLEIPVSVKTRLGYNKDELETWLPELLAENPAAIIIHARTRKEMSKVPAKWDRIKRAVEIRDELPRTVFELPRSQRTALGNEKTLIIGNGDVEDVDDAIKKCKESGADGAMIGRGIFGQPWLLSNSYKWFNREDAEVMRKKLEILVEHTKLFEEKLGGIKNFSVMKKHFKAYLKNPQLKDLRLKLMETKNAKEVETMILEFLS